MYKFFGQLQADSRTWVLCGFLVLCCACQAPLSPEESCNFQLSETQQRISWSDLPIVFYAHKSISPDKLYWIREAMRTWNEAVGFEVFELRATSDQLPDIYFQGDSHNGLSFWQDGFNGIYWAKPKIFKGFSQNSQLNLHNKNPQPNVNEQALASSLYRGDWILESDILIDSSEEFFDLEHYDSHGNLKEEAKVLKKLDFKSLIIHELGHTWGSGHDHVHTESVMYPFLGYGQVRDKISKYDLESFNCEYGMMGDI